jgi:hypothetical protein
MTGFERFHGMLGRASIRSKWGGISIPCTENHCRHVTAAVFSDQGNRGSGRNHHRSRDQNKMKKRTRRSNSLLQELAISGLADAMKAQANPAVTMAKMGLRQ